MFKTQNNTKHSIYDFFFKSIKYLIPDVGHGVLGIIETPLDPVHVGGATFATVTEDLALWTAECRAGPK